MYFPLLDFELTNIDLVTVIILFVIYLIIKRVISQTESLKSRLLIVQDDVERASTI